MDVMVLTKPATELGRGGLWSKRCGTGALQVFLGLMGVFVVGVFRCFGQFRNEIDEMLSEGFREQGDEACNSVDGSWLVN